MRRPAGETSNIPSLPEKGYGDWRLQAYTPTGTPSLRGKVSVMAGLTVKERDRGGLRLECFQKFPGRPQDAQEGLEATEPPENEEARLSESPRTKEVA